MKFLILGLLALSSLSAFAGFEVIDNTGKSLKIFNRIECNSSIDCSRGANGKLQLATSGNFESDITSTGAYSLSGFLQNRIEASDPTPTGLTVSQCGSTVYNETGNVQVDLPEASSSLGCRFTFVHLTPSGNFDVNPDDANEILYETNSIGDMIRAQTPGAAITLEAVNPQSTPTSTAAWVPVSRLDDWLDAN